MSRQIYNRYTFTSNVDFAGLVLDNGLFGYDSIIPFEPDEMIVRYVSYYSNNVLDVGTNITFVTTDIINNGSNNRIFSFTNPTNTNLELHFLLKKPLPRYIEFKCVNDDLTMTNDPVITRYGKLVFTLEFIQYK